MEIKQFWVDSDWLYLLYDNGEMARRYLKGMVPKWERIETPEVEKDQLLLVDKVQSNAGAKTTTISKRDTE